MSLAVGTAHLHTYAHWTHFPNLTEAKVEKKCVPFSATLLYSLFLSSFFFFYLMRRSVWNGVTGSWCLGSVMSWSGGNGVEDLPLCSSEELGELWGERKNLKPRQQGWEGQRKGVAERESRQDGLSDRARRWRWQREKWWSMLMRVRHRAKKQNDLSPW